jgi:hypothetical protein
MMQEFVNALSNRFDEFHYLPIGIPWRIVNKNSKTTFPPCVGGGIIGERFSWFLV